MKKSKKTKKHQKNKNNNSLVPQSIKGRDTVESDAFKWDMTELNFLFPKDPEKGLTPNFLIKKVIPELQKMRGKTWKEVTSYARNYPFDLSEISDDFYKEWLQDQHKEYVDLFSDAFFSFDLGKDGRLVGIKDNAIFRILWHDENLLPYSKIAPDWKKSNFKWSIDNLDWGFPDDVEEELTSDILKTNIISCLQQHENKTWNQVFGMKTDKSKEKHKIYTDISTCPNPDFGIKLKHKKLNVTKDKIFSFRLNNKGRIIGYIDKAVFYILWYDRNHKIWPSEKKKPSSLKSRHR